MPSNSIAIGRLVSELRRRRSIGKRQYPPEQFIGEFPRFFKERKMPGVLKPEKFLVRSLDALAVVPYQGRTAVRILSSFKEEDRYAEVGTECMKINARQFGKKAPGGKHLAAEKPEIIGKRIFRSREDCRHDSRDIREPCGAQRRTE